MANTFCISQMLGVLKHLWDHVCVAMLNRVWVNDELELALWALGDAARAEVIKIDSDVEWNFVRKVAWMEGS